MLSCLSNSYSLSKYNKTGTVGTVFTPFTFSYSTPKASTLTFTNNDDKAPVIVATEAPQNALYISNLNPLKFNQDTFTVYFKHKFTSGAIVNGTNVNGGFVIFFQTPTIITGTNNVINIFRNFNSNDITCRCVKDNTVLHSVAFTPTTVGDYLHFFLQIKPDPTNNIASTLQFNVYNTAGTRIFFNSTRINISGMGDIFASKSTSPFNMNYNGPANVTIDGIYDKAGWYNKELSNAECVAIVAESPT